MTYLIGTDKILCKVKSPLIAGWEPCADVRQLMRSAKKPIGDAVRAGVRWLGTKIPLEQMKKVLGTVHQFPHTECGFILEYRAEDGAWNIELTEQQGQPAFVHWEDTHQHDGFMSMGTIHTHPEMNAFFSGTDHHNDEGQYGVHIVLGLTKGHAVRTACRIYTPTGHYDQDIWDICEKWDMTADYEPVQAWVDIVNKGIEAQRRPRRSIFTGFSDDSPMRMFFDERGKELSEKEYCRRYGDVLPSKRLPDFDITIDHMPFGEDEDDEGACEYDAEEFDELTSSDINVELLIDYCMDVQGICHGLILLRDSLSQLELCENDSGCQPFIKAFEESIKLEDMLTEERAVVKLLEHQVLAEAFARIAGVC